MQFTFSLVALVAIVSSLPNGAPRCKITEAVITAGHKTAQTANLFTMQLPKSYTPGSTTPIPITITAAKPTAFQGILGYVTPGTQQDSTLTALPGGPAVNGVPNHVGTFQNLAALGLRAQSAAACAALNVLNDAAASTITQAQPMRATTPFTIMWMPPAQDQGTVTVNFVVSVGTRRTPWSIVQSGQIMSLGAGNGNGNGNGNATVTAVPPPGVTTTKPIVTKPAVSKTKIVVKQTKKTKAPKATKKPKKQHQDDNEGNHGKDQDDD
ncbi:UNVERIFIED_CONTAM: hypothetical protein HDU68_007346 [Siphonaria sp. JEL0065]|nr:hypothetical protein HDU68_007346 [Siphonaria sp. JEL0065]